MSKHREVDYRDCLDLAGTIAEHVECHDSDDLVGHIAQLLVPHITEVERLKEERSDLYQALALLLARYDSGDGLLHPKDRALFLTARAAIAKAEVKP